MIFIDKIHGYDMYCPIFTNLSFVGQ